MSGEVPVCPGCSSRLCPDCNQRRATHTPNGSMRWWPGGRVRGNPPPLPWLDKVNPR